MGGRMSHGACYDVAMGSNPRNARANGTTACANPWKLSQFLYTVSHSVFCMASKQNVKTGSKIKHFQEVPGWRNWQTQRTQNPPVLGTLQVRFLFPAPALTSWFFNNLAHGRGGALAPGFGGHCDQSVTNRCGVLFQFLLRLLQFIHGIGNVGTVHDGVTLEH
jgi:hypothetical protein